MDRQQSVEDKISKRKSRNLLGRESTPGFVQLERRTAPAARPHTIDQSCVHIQLSILQEGLAAEQGQ